MKRDLQGRYITISTVGEQAQAFVPTPLPPVPHIEWSVELREKYEQALIALGRLDSVSTLMPETSMFLYMYIRKEAVLSSMIEGTISSLSDLLIFENDQVPEVPLGDVQEVSNYVAALNHGVSRIKEGFPLSLRLIKEIHEILLSKGRGSTKAPGEFRKSQNWLGGTRPGNAAFVPPPPEHVLDCMGKLELFLHDEPEPTPALLKAALSHVQFETIHPFLDGNGRLGRLLITLLFCEQKVLRSPLLYLSLYFKQHREYYYEMLNNVRVNGEWESWVDFFVEAVIVTAGQAVETALELHQLSDTDRKQISGLGRVSVSALQVQNALIQHPISSPARLVEKTGLTAATVNKCIGHLEKLGIVKELTSRKRNRLFSYHRYVEIMNKGSELPE
jgi:Fic family protein